MILVGVTSPGFDRARPPPSRASGCGPTRGRGLDRRRLRPVGQHDRRPRPVAVRHRRRVGSVVPDRARRLVRPRRPAPDRSRAHRSPRTCPWASRSEAAIKVKFGAGEARLPVPPGRGTWWTGGSRAASTSERPAPAKSSCGRTPRTAFRGSSSHRTGQWASPRRCRSTSRWTPGPAERGWTSAALRLRSLDLRTGASETRVRLPRAAGVTSVRVQAGAAAVTLEVPATVAARIRSRMAVGSHPGPTKSRFVPDRPRLRVARLRDRGEPYRHRPPRRCGFDARWRGSPDREPRPGASQGRPPATCPASVEVSSDHHCRQEQRDSAGSVRFRVAVTVSPWSRAAGAPRRHDFPPGVTPAPDST